MSFKHLLWVWTGRVLLFVLFRLFVFELECKESHIYTSNSICFWTFNLTFAIIEGKVYKICIL